MAEKQENSPLLTQAKKAVETALLLRTVLKKGADLSAKMTKVQTRHYAGNKEPFLERNGGRLPRSERSEGRVGNGREPAMSREQGSHFQEENGGSDGARTRDLRRDRPTL